MWNYLSQHGFVSSPLVGAPGLILAEARACANLEKDATREKKKWMVDNNVCVMGRLVHTGLGSSSLVAHVLHSPPPPTRTAFAIGPAVIKHTHNVRDGQTSPHRSRLVVSRITCPPLSSAKTQTPQTSRYVERRREGYACTDMFEIEWSLY